MIVVGLGWQKAALASNALELVVGSLEKAGVPVPAYIAAPDFKKEDILPQAVAEVLGAEVLWINPLALQQMQACCQTFSTTVSQHVGVASVAEACALAGAGQGSFLRLPRQAFCGVTCAVAEGD